MTKIKLPLILSPSLGCPQIVSIDSPNQYIQVIIAAKEVPRDGWRLAPSNKIDGNLLAEIKLIIPEDKNPIPISSNSNLAFNSLDDTRKIISEEIKNNILSQTNDWNLFECHLVFQEALKDANLRVSGQNKLLPTLYDLELNGSTTKKHAVCIINNFNNNKNFIHLTDIHLARRNDIIKDEISSDNGQPNKYNNFNQNTRDFIKIANTQADTGQLDFILIGGDLIDFVNQGFSNNSYLKDNNWKFFIEVFTGSKSELQLGNEGIRVPIFTTTGNHDWRFNPYDISSTKNIFSLEKKEAAKFNSTYYDSKDNISNKIEEIYKIIVKKGSPVLKESFPHQLAKNLLKLLEKPTVKIGGIFSIYSALYSLIHPETSPFDFMQINKFNLSDSKEIVALVLTVFFVLFLNFCKTKYGNLIRRMIKEGIIPIEAKVNALHDYFTHINPFFNYAFSYGNANFILMDTGPDCFTGQSFWDKGNKKMKRLTIKDNILGGSPDSMSFYPINEYYSYGQINWLEKVLNAIYKNGNENNRIFICLHAPPINLKRNPKILPGKLEQLVTDNIRFGTINHFLSQFYHLCLGKKENDPSYSKERVDMVFCGHAHQNIEFRIEENEKLFVYCGNYSENLSTNNFEGKKPYILQSAAVGPLHKDFENPPYYRYIKIGAKNEIISFKSLNVPRIPDSCET